MSWAPDNRLIVEGVSRDDLAKLGVEFGVFFTGLDAVPGGREADPRAAHRPVSQSSRQHGRRLDAVDARAVRVSVHHAAGIPTCAAGDLSKFDVLLFADEADTTILNGAAAGTMPADYVGGIGMEGAANVRRFVERGGWLVAWDRASDFAILALDLPLRNSVKDTRSEEFFIPGSLLRINTKPAHPLAAGMEASAVAMFADSQAFQIVAPAAEGKQRAPRDVDVFVEYPRQNFMVSGWELGGSRYLAGRVAAAHVKVGDGHAVVMGFRPHWRGQPHNTFKLLFNPLFLSTIEGSMPATTAGQ